MSLQLTKPNGDVLIFDAITSQSSSKRISVSSHPLENGSSVQDHAQEQPASYSFTGVVSMNPLEIRGFTAGQSRLNEVLAFLDSAAGEPLTMVADRYGTVDPVLLTSYRNQAPGSQELRFDLTLQAVSFATAATVLIPAPVASVEPQLAEEQDAGTQGTESDTDTAEERSILASIIGLGG